ncbi:MAG: hypothetical protein ACRC2T_13935 [Thermoguttaceae bacterium]
MEAKEQIRIKFEPQPTSNGNYLPGTLIFSDDAQELYVIIGQKWFCFDTKTGKQLKKERIMPNEFKVRDPQTNQLTMPGAKIWFDEANVLLSNGYFYNYNTGEAKLKENDFIGNNYYDIQSEAKYWQSSKDNKFFAALYEIYHVRTNLLAISDMQTGKQICTIPSDYEWDSFAFMPDSSIFVTVLNPKKLKKYDYIELYEISSFHSPEKTVYDDDVKVVFEFWDLNDIYWDKHQVNMFPRKIGSFIAKDISSVKNITFSPDGKLLFATSETEYVDAGSLAQIAAGYIFSVGEKTAEIASIPRTIDYGKYYEHESYQKPEPPLYFLDKNPAQKK